MLPYCVIKVLATFAPPLSYKSEQLDSHYSHLLEHQVLTHLNSTFHNFGSVSSKGYFGKNSCTAVSFANFGPDQRNGLR
ncbi:hypothetical protein PNOK_0417500 [Pyrrhoderma noxium]|uniref:Uncharacterized protein n=1 Tax=Pyrrhoderma noxium TaxID=2282107 RepID=A0A286UI12_9AGAM|nr:hypothetical protein PNOK_0417500 [Pyrrhoderma noxium]